MKNIQLFNDWRDGVSKFKAGIGRKFFLTSLESVKSQILSSSKSKTILFHSVEGDIDFTFAAAKYFVDKRGKMFLTFNRFPADNICETLSKFKGSIYFDRIRTINNLQAKKFVKHSGVLSLIEVEEINLETAQILGQRAGDLEIGLKFLPATIATELAKIRGNLSFPRLECMDADVASIFRNFAGGLYLPSVKCLSNEVLQHLVTIRKTLSIGITNLTIKNATLLATSKSNIELNNVATLNSQVAEELFKSKAALMLCGLQKLNSNTCSLLLSHERGITLNSKVFVAGKETLNLLSKYKGKINGIKSRDFVEILTFSQNMLPRLISDGEELVYDCIIKAATCSFNFGLLKKLIQLREKVYYAHINCGKIIAKSKQEEETSEKDLETDEVRSFLEIIDKVLALNLKIKTTGSKCYLNNSKLQQLVEMVNSRPSNADLKRLATELINKYLEFRQIILDCWHQNGRKKLPLKKLTIIKPVFADMSKCEKLINEQLDNLARFGLPHSKKNLLAEYRDLKEVVGALRQLPGEWEIKENFFS